MAKTLAHSGHHESHGGGGMLAAALVLAVLILAVWGAWKLGVMAGDRVDLPQRLTDLPAVLRKAPNPQPIPIPTQRRPGVETQQR